MGQLEQESRCVVDIRAYDGGMGLAQFMPKTAEWLHEQEPELQKLFEKPAPYDPLWSIRAMILYDRWLYPRTSCTGWYFAFRAYNGGIGNINREISQAGCCKKATVESYCNRAGKFCEWNIEYPYKIFQKAEKYR